MVDEVVGTAGDAGATSRPAREGGGLAGLVGGRAALDGGGLPAEPAVVGVGVGRQWPMAACSGGQSAYASTGTATSAKTTVLTTSELTRFV
jgi:hypothetical protein